MTNAKTSDLDKLVDAMLALAVEQGWNDISLAAIAERAELSLASSFAAARNKGTLIDAYIARLDDAMLAEDYGFTVDQPVRDQLFDLAMTRFEAMQPHRIAVANILHADGLNRASQFARAGKRSAALMLEAAGVSSDGLSGQARASALNLSLVQVGRTFLKDESEDLAPTMRALDKALTSLERWAIDAEEFKKGGFGRFAFGGSAFKDFGDRMRRGTAGEP